MGDNQNGNHRGLKGNATLSVFAVILGCAVIVAAVLLYQKMPAVSVIGSGIVPQSSSNAGTSSTLPTQSQAPSSSAPSGASSSAPGTSSATVKLSSYNAATFKGALFIGDSFAQGLGIYDSAYVTDIIGKTTMTSYSAISRKYTVGGKQQTVAVAASTSGASSIYIELGSNDVTMGRSAAKFSTYYGELLDSLKSSCGSAKLYVQSVFPVTAAYEAKTGVTNAKIDAYNAALRTLCTEKSATFLDAASALKGTDGALQADLTADGIHIKKKGYSLWLSYLAGSIAG